MIHAVRVLGGLWLVAALSGAALGAGASSPRAGGADQVQLQFFESKIRPMLSEHCYRCHSARSEKLKGGLHLDSRDGLIKGGDGGPAIEAGDPEKSRLIEAIRYTNQDTAMPPAGKLPDAVIKDLETWVKMGAPWPVEAAPVAAARQAGPDYAALRREHWAYQPIHFDSLPAVKNSAWPRNGIDRFILASLEAEHLKPVADADRAALIRRLYFDLIGLPPTPKQIDAFTSDPSPTAYAAIVDELLASPQFGERWGRHWLDVARYGESLTLRGFVLPGTWRYRDYVIETFNSDRPFNVFMQEQVAGDLMPADSVAQRRRQMIGTTFLAMGNTNLEEQDKKQLRMDVVDEQLDTLGKAFLGQTIGCARCHDHKFDPITAADYYAMAGILRNAKALEHDNVSKWISVPLPEEPAIEAELSRHEAALSAIEAKLNAARATLASATNTDSATLPKNARPKVVAVKDLPGIVIDDAGAKRVGEWISSTSIASYIGDGYLHDDNAGKGEKSLSFQPEFKQSGRYEVRLSYATAKRRATNVPVTILSEEGEKTVSVNERTPPLIGGRFVSLGVYRFEKDSQAYVLVSNEGTDGFVAVDAVQFLPVDDSLVAAATSAGDKAGPNKKLEEEIQSLEAEVKQLREAGPKRQMILSVVEEKEIGDTQIHVRGVVQTLGATVPRGFLSCVSGTTSPAIPADQSGRLQLGQWLADARNPLPARVMANRVWHWLMGQGIVRTVDNLGTTGELPSHPQLLDYLATRFVEEGWSVKKLVREIVLSRAYQLSTASDPTNLAADPENRLHWRMDRRRLDAECIRDAMLAVGGTLDLTAGGQTYPAGLERDYGHKPTATRRSVYVPAFRNALPELFEAFDFADPSMVVGRRTVSTVAPQALYMLNHPFPREQAAAAAKRLLESNEMSGTTDAERLVYACRLTLGRDPTAGEHAVLMQFIQGSWDVGGEHHLAAWTEVFHALFASTDFRYVN